MDRSCPKQARSRRFAAVALLVAVAVCMPATLVSFNAAAGDDPANAAFRLYFAIPFVASRERKPARIGFQFLSEMDDQSAYGPLAERHRLQTAIDLGFTRNGLAKFDVIGADMRGAYEVFARAIGLTPEEVELCRDSDCLDWVKPNEPAVVPSQEIARD